MDLLLLYPVNGVTQVKIKILTVSIIKLLSNQQNIVDGSIHKKILKAICSLEDKNIADLSMVDSLRIIMSSWVLTHSAKEWATTHKCDCGAWAVNVLKHEIDPNKIKALDIYEQSLKVDSVDSAGEPHTYSIDLKPLSTKFLSDVMASGSIDPANLTFLQVQSIDNNKNYDEDSIPISVWKAVRNAVAPEMEHYANVSTLKQPCVQCENELESTIGFHNVAWLENSNV